jgi:hypothetical protein
MYCTISTLKKKKTSFYLKKNPFKQNEKNSRNSREITLHLEKKTKKNTIHCYNKIMVLTFKEKNEMA